ncbi:MAG TPA: ABC transporter ATP-binding protein [Candidatus Poseidoniaceae archaeon]|nr:MAG TPA: ABC transporter ATP-binding protein [Candidatus Poseidoniales archaeon]DAC61590.1 MAG TPA: ABC transporter ATP-binding protein [Candidatus Poseidoniales archaeon]HII23777.1 ABC transporter ATP-binding protein [Candidatus Poseidoniaceae archaeon]HII49769.1 ABC transporter ATP-binding protein [Candidatus Poseidoniaceae archaeon]
MGEVGPFRRLLSHMKDHRKTIRLASLCSVTNKIWDLAPPLLIGLAVDVVVLKEDSFLASMGYSDPWNQLILLSVLTFAIWGLESLFEYFYGVLWRNLAQTVQHELRLDTFNHVQKQGMGWFDERQKGDILAILNDDINQLERFLDKGANDLLQVSTTVLVVGAIFLFISWEVALFAIIPIPLIVWGSFKYQRSLEPKYADVRNAAGKMNALLENDLSGMSTIQSFTSEEIEVDRVRNLSDDYREANRKAIRLSAAFTPLIRMAILCGFTATLLLGGWYTLEGDLAVGAYSVLVFMTQRLLWPLTRLGETFDLYQRAMASSTRVLDVLTSEIEISEGAFTPKRDMIENSEIVFENVDFSYTGRENTFSDLSLTLSAGKTTGIVGSTGAGKTTLTRLLLRFAQPNSGRIVWAGKGIDEWSLKHLRSSIALVEQHITLFPTSILENIRYGDANATDEEVYEAAKIAEVSEFVNSLPEKWDTMVGEGGYRLSGGQRQRLAIARAVLKNAPLLILDEATSAVDNETEAALQRSIELVGKDRTTVIIAHRLSTIRSANTILVMDNGKIVERGTHDDLIQKEGIYQKLWKVQTGEK